MRRVLKWGCLGVLGLVALVTVMGVIGVIVAPAPSHKEMQKIKEQGAQQEQPTQPQKQAQPQGPEDYLEVSGTPGIPFSCAVMDGNGQQRTVDGRVPTKIPLKDMGFGASSYNSCQKSGADGTLEVAIYVGGEEKASNKTSAQYGVVSVDYPQ